MPRRHVEGEAFEDTRAERPSNAAFDADLRARNPAWGIRDLEAVATLATDHGFSALDIEAMPANNFSLFCRRH